MCMFTCLCAYSSHVATFIYPDSNKYIPHNLRVFFHTLKPSGHYMHRTVVSICTTSLTFSNSTFCPHNVFMCFVWTLEQTTIISLHNINWLVCITETECVYCAVRTGCFIVIPVTLDLQQVAVAAIMFVGSSIWTWMHNKEKFRI